jgi:hypothetical protein
LDQNAAVHPQNAADDGDTTEISGTGDPAIALCDDGHIAGMAHPALYGADYSTVTDFARLRGWSTSVPIHTAV